MTTTDLAARLRAVVEERLAVARAATPGPWHWWHPPSWDHTGPDLHGPDEIEIAVARGYDESCLEIRDGDAEFIALNDPADVILACQRDLAVLERHGARDYNDGPGCAPCGGPWPCPEVRDMATRYRMEVT